MTAWKASTLGEVVSIAGGGTPTRSNPDFYGGTIPWVTPKDMKSWEITGAQITITQSGLDSSAARLVPKNSILIVVRSGVLKHTIPVGLNRLPVAINQDMKALQCRNGIDADFLARFIKAQSPIILQWVRATTADNFPIDKLKKLPVPLPPLAEQRRIAEVLDRAEALRATRRSALAQLDLLTKSLFLDLFGDPVTNRKGLPILRMGDVCDVRDGTHDSPKYVSDGGYPLVTSKNLSAGVVDLNDVNLISEADYVQINKRSKVDRGDIIMPMIGTIGSPVLVEDEPRYAIKNVALIKFTAVSPSPVFVRHLLNCHYFDHIIGQKNRGGTQKFVSLGDLRSFPLPLPAVELQREFACRDGAVEKLKMTQRASLAELDALFASLQYRAFRGEL